MWPFNRGSPTPADIDKWVSSGKGGRILAVIDSAAEDEIKAHAASVLPSVGGRDLGENGRARVLSLLSTADEGIRRAALKGVAANPEPYAAEALFRAIESADEEGRTEAYGQLNAFLSKWGQTASDPELQSGKSYRLADLAHQMALMVRSTAGNAEAFHLLLSAALKSCSPSGDYRRDPLLDAAARMAVLGSAYVDHAIRAGAYDPLRIALRRVGASSTRDPKWEARCLACEALVRILQESGGDAREEVATRVVAVFCGADVLP